MTDYNLLAKAEVEKYRDYADGTVNRVNMRKGELGTVYSEDKELESCKSIAAQAQQGIIDALEETIVYYEIDCIWQTEAKRTIRNKIIHYINIKTAIENYKP